jgi:hypothetical protein
MKEGTTVPLRIKGPFRVLTDTISGVSEKVFGLLNTKLKAQKVLTNSCTKRFLTKRGPHPFTEG